MWGGSLHPVTFHQEHLAGSMAGGKVHLGASTRYREMIVVPSSDSEVFFFFFFSPCQSIVSLFSICPNAIENPTFDKPLFISI